MATTTTKTLRIICAPTPLPTSPILCLPFPHDIPQAARKNYNKRSPLCEFVPHAGREQGPTGRRWTRYGRTIVGCPTHRTGEGPAPDAPAARFAPSLPALRRSQAVLRLVHAPRRLP